jgi:hypothetical protein
VCFGEPEEVSPEEGEGKEEEEDGRRKKALEEELSLRRMSSIVAV